MQKHDLRVRSLADELSAFTILFTGILMFAAAVTYELTHVPSQRLATSVALKRPSLAGVSRPGEVPAAANRDVDVSVAR